MSNLSALQSALSGLLAQRQRLDVIGHNVANATTDGYSRQRVDLQSGGNGPVPALFSDGLVTGDGVDVSGVLRFRDAFLETRALGERSAAAHLDLASKYLDRIELVHTEPSDSGLAASLDQLWASFDDVANHPGEIPQRAAALEQAAATVDQRDVALGKLADLVGARVEDRDDGTVDVYVGGSTLVHGTRTVEMTSTTVPDPGLADVGVQRLTIQWVGGADVVPNGGEAAGLLTVANTTIPDAIRGLDAIADALVTEVNTLHAGAQDLDGNTGWDFFEPTGTTAGTLALSADVDGQPRRISAAEVGAGEWDASVAQQIANLRELVDGPDDQYSELVGSLGVQVGSTRARANAQASVLQRVDEARLSARSVNIDEEMIDLVAAQRAYEASARIINVVDEMLDVLINRLGLVGR